ncbi:hypothetical protein EJ04DRAFT_271797 [Polyplosphaeria fusca]|uniref:Uncharacterized protein n=1 Tax=Polyplosphaeria fusca TaxID=682080 RepID=A0A9P4V1P4_9PLEO|nr:hypothetical protein EJ04DRAFT_271797 [Polyplosphaeria fusca]
MRPALQRVNDPLARISSSSSSSVSIGIACSSAGDALQTAERLLLACERVAGAVVGVGGPPLVEKFTRARLHCTANSG